MSDTSSTDDPSSAGSDPSYGHDQDAEPPLTASGLDGPTAADDDPTGDPVDGGNPDADDQDAQPSTNAPRT
ncbi:hypothetical protein GGQ22_04795 [Nocardioides sp. zg-579]|uniref:Uncharacterized protein n=1 Tax=Nocardioides marmotae TaxID=2663857 RepID=A0A6I3J5B6_9ACTN|nr:hypothetical protein [Nocardioides marmotae]MCR6030760.1 hypothetical protein [Gordonia jinghuaiqii]MTB94394.1 hypothetical protein [Nocardioides marmotae]QKE01580.1 hypothetical protein HPC71_11200 [Nocardioides marmotae]